MRRLRWHGGDIDSAPHALIQRVLNGERGIKLADGRQLWYRTPCKHAALKPKAARFFARTILEKRTESTPDRLDAPGDLPLPVHGTWFGAQACAYRVGAQTHGQS